MALSVYSYACTLSESTISGWGEVGVGVGVVSLMHLVSNNQSTIVEVNIVVMLHLLLMANDGRLSAKEEVPSRQTFLKASIVDFCRVWARCF